MGLGCLTATHSPQQVMARHGPAAGQPPWAGSRHGVAATALLALGHGALIGRQTATAPGCHGHLARTMRAQQTEA
jgi:hypothetical protein